MLSSPPIDSQTHRGRHLSQRDKPFREGPLNTMIGGIPEVPAPFGSPLVYPFGLGVPPFIRRPSGFHHFHGFHR
jgi:hypothetical protein